MATPSVTFDCMECRLRFRVTQPKGMELDSPFGVPAMCFEYPESAAHPRNCSAWAEVKRRGMHVNQ